MNIFRALLCCAFSCVVLSCSHNPAHSLARGYDATVARDVGLLREATAPFRTLDGAVAAGYPRVVKDCLVHEHQGAMGYHHVNPKLVDRTLDVRHPEILLYERVGAEYRLNAVEFILPYRLWPRDSIPPRLMGQALRHEDNLNIWYLHVWAWKQNPEGLFANFHPGVMCSAEDRKIFIPSEEHAMR